MGLLILVLAGGCFGDHPETGVESAPVEAAAPPARRPAREPIVSQGRTERLDSPNDALGDDAPDALHPAALPEPQPRPPASAGTVPQQLAWLFQHGASPTLPDRGCRWLPAAAGCATRAWTCAASASEAGPWGRQFATSAVFGTDAEVYAAFDPDALQPLDGLDDGAAGTAGPGDGEEELLLVAGEEVFGAQIYTSCMGSAQEAQTAACENEVAAVAGTTGTRCTVVSVNACAQTVGLRCVGVAHDRASRPVFRAVRYVPVIDPGGD